MSAPAPPPPLSKEEFEKEKKAVIAVCNTIVGTLATSGPEGRAALMTTLAPKGSATHARWNLGKGFEYESFPDELADRPKWDTPPNTIEEAMDGEPTVMIDRDLAMVWSPFYFKVKGKLTHVGTNVFTLLKARWDSDGEKTWKVTGICDTARNPTEEERQRLDN